MRPSTGTKPRLAVPSKAFATSSSSIWRQGPENDWDELEAAAGAEKRLDKKKNPYATREDFRDNGTREKRTPDKLQRAVRKELQYTTDPYHIAESVQKKLRENDFEKALMVTREASKDKQVIVSWNHLIEHQFANHKLGAAIKLYNEVGPRLQPPALLLLSYLRTTKLTTLGR